MSNEICPWCQTDIIWDEEIGPESVCPHCENELKDYRSLTLDLTEPEDLANLENKIEAYRESMEQAWQCLQCHGEMIMTGEQLVSRQMFSPWIPESANGPFLAAPFKVEVHVCPDCLELRYRLSEEDRLKLLK